MIHLNLYLFQKLISLHIQIYFKQHSWPFTDMSFSGKFLSVSSHVVEITLVLKQKRSCFFWVSFNFSIESKDKVHILCVSRSCNITITSVFGLEMYFNLY